MSFLTQTKMKEILLTKPSDLPSDFEKWLLDVFDVNYMYYHKISTKEYFCYCSCGADNIPLEKPKSGQHIICPCCGKKVQLKNDIYKHRELHTTVRAYLEECSSGYIERLFIVNNITTYNPNTVPRIMTEVRYHEEQRSILPNDGDGKKFTIHPYTKYDFYAKKSTTKWLKGRAHKHGESWKGWWAEDCKMEIYPKNLHIFKNSKYKYAEMGRWVENIKFDPLWYLENYIKKPQIEFLIKLKLYNVAISYLIDNGWSSRWLNCSGKTVFEICGLKAKKDIDFASMYNLTPLELKAYLIMKNEWKNDITLDAVKFRAVIIDASDVDFKYDFISFERLYNYYLENKKHFKHIRDFWSDYRDYISAAIYLKMDLSDTKVRTPHDFKYCHNLCCARKDELIEKRRVMKIARNTKNFKNISKKYNKIFSYNDKKYSILVPLTKEDLKTEGRQNNNCVGGYWERIAEGNSIVLFLRETKNIAQSFCTVELQTKTLKIIQCRTKGNGAAPDKVVKWLEKIVSKIKPIYQST